jgi:DNA-binding transcriptional MerR regulator
MDRLRCTGMSIAQMRRYTLLVREGSRTLRQRQKLLLLHRAQVRQTIAEWTQALKLIDSKIDYYGGMAGHRKEANHPGIVEAALRAGSGKESTAPAGRDQGKSQKSERRLTPQGANLNDHA